MLVCSVNLFGCTDVAEDIQNVAESVYNENEAYLTDINNHPFIHLEVVARSDVVTYYKEPVTGVMYLYSGYKGGFTIMYDSSGLPLSYERFVLLYQEWRTDYE